MKRFLSCILLLAALHTHAAEVNASFTNNPNAVIPDANPAGKFFTIDVAGIEGWVTNVSISLKLSGGYNGDIYGYLTSDDGGFVVLLNRVGKTSSNPFGYEDAGMDVTFSDWAASDVHLYGGLNGNPLSGIWQPDGRNNNPQTVLDSDDRTSFLSSFRNRNPNGTWTLFLADFASGGESTLLQWKLDIQTIPEPSSAGIVSFGVLTFWFLRKGPSKKRPSLTSAANLASSVSKKSLRR